MTITTAEVRAIVDQPPRKDWREIRDVVERRRRVVEGIIDERLWWGRFLEELP